MLVVLTGMRGAGKTAVGRILAESLGFEFVDMDSEIEREAGKSVAEIFSESGESAFRKMEADLAAELAEKKQCVVASGGGTVASKIARNTLLKNAVVVYLKAGADTLAGRIKGDASSASRRPHLTNAADIKSELAALLAERKRFYESTADYIVDTDARSPREIAAQIEKHIRSEQ
jgi:shikimate kinase